MQRLRLRQVGRLQVAVLWEDGQQKAAMQGGNLDWTHCWMGGDAEQETVFAGSELASGTRESSRETTPNSSPLCYETEAFFLSHSILCSAEDLVFLLQKDICLLKWPTHPTLEEEEVCDGWSSWIPTTRHSSNMYALCKHLLDVLKKGRWLDSTFWDSLDHFFSG